MLYPLTTLRFIFALMVFLSHSVFFMPGGEQAHPRLYATFHEGFIGVSFFFILSGFILSYRYLNPADSGPLPVKRFWIKRFSRIYPIYLFSLVFAAGLGLDYLHRDPGGFFKELALSVGMLQTLVADGRYSFNFNAPAWSVADEMIFYLLFPLLLRIANRPWLWYALLAAGIILVIGEMLVTPPGAGSYTFYRNPFVRVLDFALGIALFQHFQRRPQHSWSRSKGNFMEWSSVLILGLFLLFRNEVPLHWRYSAYYWIPMLVLIYTFAKGAGQISAFFTKPFPVLLGEASYSFYLIHVPVAILLLIVFRKLGWTPGPAMYIGTHFILTLAGSVILFRFLERPLNRFLRSRLLNSRQDLH